MTFNEETGEATVKYKPDQLALIRGPIGKGKEGVATIVYHLPPNLAYAMFETLNNLPMDERENAVKIFAQLMIKSIRLFVGFQQAAQKALEKVYGDTMKELER